MEMCKPKCYTCFLWYEAHMVVPYVDFEKLCRTENLFWIKILKQQVDYAKKDIANIRFNHIQAT